MNPSFVSFLLKVARRYIGVGELDEAKLIISEVIRNSFAGCPIGIDLDGTCDESPDFFSLLTVLWPGTVTIITYRSSLEKAKEYLKELSIRYDDLVLVESFEEKAKIIDEKGIKVYFDDMDEVISHISEDVCVLKVRNPGNFKSGRWLYSNKTGEAII